MVQQDDKDMLIPTIRDVCEIEAEELAAQYGLDHARVCRIAARTIRDFEKCSLSARLDEAILDSDWNYRFDFIFNPSLREALRYLSPEVALALFESTDLEALRERQNLITFLWSAGPLYPLASLDEMAEVVDAFLSYRERERAHLLRTGLPSRRFAGIGWLSWQLFYLYPTRFPELAPPPPSDGVEPVMLLWPEHVEDAPPIPELQASDRSHLESMRPRLFDLEAAVLREFAAALRTRTAAGLWDRCLALLTDALLADDIDVLLRADRCYIGFDAWGGSDTSVEARIPIGGLTGLLVLIGDIEEAISLGTYARIRAALDPVMVPWERPGWWCLQIVSYYQLVHQPGWERQGAALDAVGALAPRCRAFWREYRRRVNQALDEDFDVTLPSRRVKRKHRAQVEPFLRSLFDMVCAYVEVTGTLPALNSAISLLGAGTTEAGNVFRKEGRFWTIRYRGEVVHVPDSLGWRYIAYLVRYEGREFHALQLVSLVRGLQTEVADAQLSALSGEALADLGLSIVGFGDAGEQLSQQALNELRQARHDYQEDLRDAEANKDQERIAQVTAALAYVEQELSNALGLGGRTRKAADTKEKARKSVSVAITRGLKDIRGDHPDLFEHLNAALKRGDFFLYEPATSPRWQL